MSTTATNRVAEWEKRIADVKACLPKHVILPTRLIVLADLDEAQELARIQTEEENRR